MDATYPILLTVCNLYTVVRYRGHGDSGAVSVHIINVVVMHAVVYRVLCLLSGRCGFCLGSTTIGELFVSYTLRPREPPLGLRRKFADLRAEKKKIPADLAPFRPDPRQILRIWGLGGKGFS